MTNTIEIENLNISDLDIPTDETLQEVATACEDIATKCDNVATNCDNIATACGDIAKDTTLQSTNTALGSLATDATLQATNTALGGLSTAVGDIIKDTTGQSINTSVGAVSSALADVATDTTLATVAKDTTLQATNTALASLATDTTAQSIASAISGLGQTLGSDRALIDGSNIGDKATFRQNIGLEYNVSSQTYDGLTWTVVKLGKLYFLTTEITIPANTTPATVGSLYIYRGSSKQWWSLPIEFTKKLCDVSWTGGSPYAWGVNYTDITSRQNSATSADVARSTQTSSAITVNKFICGYVS